MERNKEHFHYLLLYCFSKKQAADPSKTYSESAPSVKTCEYWFRRFKNDNFDLKDKECSSQLKKFEDANCRHC